MSYPDERAKDWMKEVYRERLSDLCKIESKSRTADGAGGASVSHPEAEAALPCRVVQPTETEMEEEGVDASKYTNRTARAIMFEEDVVLDMGQRVVVGGGKTYEVVKIMGKDLTDSFGVRILAVAVD
jgi:hypothetical protein